MIPVLKYRIRTVFTLRCISAVPGLPTPAVHPEILAPPQSTQQTVCRNHHGNSAVDNLFTGQSLRQRPLPAPVQLPWKTEPFCKGRQFLPRLSVPEIDTRICPAGRRHHFLFCRSFLPAAALYCFGEISSPRQISSHLPDKAQSIHGAGQKTLKYSVFLHGREHPLQTGLIRLPQNIRQRQKKSAFPRHAAAERLHLLPLLQKQITFYIKTQRPVRPFSGKPVCHSLQLRQCNHGNHMAFLLLSFRSPHVLTFLTHGQKYLLIARLTFFLLPDQIRGQNLFLQPGNRRPPQFIDPFQRVKAILIRSNLHLCRPKCAVSQLSKLSLDIFPCDRLLPRTLHHVSCHPAAFVLTGKCNFRRISHMKRSFHMNGTFRLSGKMFLPYFR